VAKIFNTNLLVVEWYWRNKVISAETCI